MKSRSEGGAYGSKRAKEQRAQAAAEGFLSWSNHGGKRTTRVVLQRREWALVIGALARDCAWCISQGLDPHLMMDAQLAIAEAMQEDMGHEEAHRVLLLVTTMLTGEG